MKNASKVMYRIARIFTIVAAALCLVASLVAGILTIVGAFSENISGAYWLGRAIASIVWLGIEIAIFFVGGKALKDMEQDEKNQTPHIICIVIGVIGNIFYLLGGIFGLIAISQESDSKEQPKEEVQAEKKEEQPAEEEKAE